MSDKDKKTNPNPPKAAHRIGDLAPRKPEIVRVEGPRGDGLAYVPSGPNRGLMRVRRARTAGSGTYADVGGARARANDAASDLLGLLRKQSRAYPIGGPCFVVGANIRRALTEARIDADGAPWRRMVRGGPSFVAEHPTLGHVTIGHGDDDEISDIELDAYATLLGVTRAALDLAVGLTAARAEEARMAQAFRAEEAQIAAAESAARADARAAEAEAAAAEIRRAGDRAAAVAAEAAAKAAAAKAAAARTGADA